MLNKNEFLIFFYFAKLTNTFKFDTTNLVPRYDIQLTFQNELGTYLHIVFKQYQ